jgi:hypothetical protein
MNNNTKRKRGRPAGSTSFARVKIADLIAQLGTNFTVTVSKKWLEDIGLEVDSGKPNRVIAAVESEESLENKIQFTEE